MHLPARLWPVGAGACEVYGSDRLHPSTVQGCVMVVRHARRQFRGQSSLRVSPVQQSCWQPTEQQSAEGAKPACCIAPPPCVACPPAFLAPVGRLRSRAHAGKRCSAHSAPIQCLPPCLYAFRRGARDDARGSSRSSSCWSRASSSHSFHGAWATDAMATRRWNSGGAILPGSDADARVDVGGVGGLAR